ncbi:MAG: hypothetical protein MZV49_10720 [Rhodopseudomonas palustris]|nr:hypothetical protein [Rhodopseudomonas palustris]
MLITDHNVRETLGICSRAYIVSAGSVIASGSAEEILANPQVREVYLGAGFQSLTTAAHADLRRPARITPMLKPALQLKLGQQLTMTPQLQQAIRLLQLPMLELQAQVQRRRSRPTSCSRPRKSEQIDLAAARPAGAARRSEDDDGRAARPMPTRSSSRWTDPLGGILDAHPATAARRTTTTGRSSSPTERGRDLHQHLVWQLEVEPARPAPGLDRRGDRRRAERRRLPDRIRRRHRAQT